MDSFFGNYSGNQVAFIDGEEFTVKKYRNHALVSIGNTPRVYLMTCDSTEDGNEETSNLIPLANKTPASTSSNTTVDQSSKSKEMLENFVHDA